MRTLTASAACLAALLQAPCAWAAPVPDSKVDYVGAWAGPGMTLKIGRDGRIAYRRTGQDLNVDVTIELMEFQGDDFAAGVGPFRTIFRVTQPPRAKGLSTTMVVDGVELTKGD